jgi:predicted N-acetyltransferase YhbS
MAIRGKECRSGEMTTSGSAVNLRDARPDELDEVAEVINAAYQQFAPFLSGELTSFQEDMRNVLNAGDTQKIVAEYAGRIVGVIVIYSDASRYGKGLPAQWAALRLLSVLPESRRLGVGRALMEEGLRRGREQGATEMILHTLPFMTEAISLHESVGFARAPDLDANLTPTVKVLAYRRRL